jgi:hypothetical protein
MSTPLFTFFETDSTLLNIVPAGDEQTIRASLLQIGKSNVRPFAMELTQKRLLLRGISQTNFFDKYGVFGKIHHEHYAQQRGNAAVRRTRERLSGDYFWYYKVLMDEREPNWFYALNEFRNVLHNHGQRVNAL